MLLQLECFCDMSPESLPWKNSYQMVLHSNIRTKLKFWIPALLWGLYLASFIGFLYNIPKHEDNPATEIKQLKIFNQQRNTYSLWNREKTIEFGFTQLTTTINYLFIAAAGLLGFVGKSVIDPIMREAARHLDIIH